MKAPSIYAHRGAKVSAPENTLSAFLLAARLGADGIELDVKLTRDGRVIVLHDPTLDRTTNGRGRYDALDYQELRQLDAGSWFDPRFSGERLPLLEEVFEAVGDRLAINIELTNYTTPRDRLVEEVARLVNRLKDPSGILFSSFFPENLLRARALCPSIPTGLLASPGLLGWPARTWIYRRPAYSALHPFTRDTSTALVRRAHAHGRRVHVWTVNEEGDMRRLAALGVDMIMTDDPARARAVLG